MILVPAGLLPLRLRVALAIPLRARKGWGWTRRDAFFLVPGLSTHEIDPDLRGLVFADDRAYVPLMVACPSSDLVGMASLRHQLGMYHLRAGSLFLVGNAAAELLFGGLSVFRVLMLQEGLGMRGLLGGVLPDPAFAFEEIGMALLVLLGGLGSL